MKKTKRVRKTKKTKTKTQKKSYFTKTKLWFLKVVGLGAMVLVGAGALGFMQESALTINKGATPSVSTSSNSMILGMNHLAGKSSCVEDLAASMCTAKSKK